MRSFCASVYLRRISGVLDMTVEIRFSIEYANKNLLHNAHLV